MSRRRRWRLWILALRRSRIYCLKSRTRGTWAGCQQRTRRRCTGRACPAADGPGRGCTGSEKRPAKARRLCWQAVLITDGQRSGRSGRTALDARGYDLLAREIEADVPGVVRSGFWKVASGVSESSASQEAEMAGGHAEHGAVGRLLAELPSVEPAHTHSLRRS